MASHEAISSSVQRKFIPIFNCLITDGSKIRDNIPWGHSRESTYFSRAVIWAIALTFSWSVAILSSLMTSSRYLFSVLMNSRYPIWEVVRGVYQQWYFDGKYKLFLNLQYLTVHSNYEVISTQCFFGINSKIIKLH